MSPLSRPTFPRFLLTLGVAAALVPASASAAGNPVIRDCTDDGRLSKKYSQKQYSEALKNIPTDVDEYTDCRDVIRREQLRSAGSGGGGSSAGSTGGGSDSTAGGASGTSGGGGGGGDSSHAGTADEALQSASAHEKAAIDQARETAVDAPIQVGGESLTPAELTKSDVGALSTVPTPLLIVLVLLTLAALAGGGSAILSRVRAHRSSPTG